MVIWRLFGGVVSDIGVSIGCRRLLAAFRSADKKSRCNSSKKYRSSNGAQVGSKVISALLELPTKLYFRRELSTKILTWKYDCNGNQKRSCIIMCHVILKNWLEAGFGATLPNSVKSVSNKTQIVPLELGEENKPIKSCFILVTWLTMRLWLELYIFPILFF